MDGIFDRGFFLLLAALAFSALLAYAGVGGAMDTFKIVVGAIIGYVGKGTIEELRAIKEFRVKVTEGGE